MKWPVWIPYPRSWFRAAALAVMLICIEAILRVLGYWSLLPFALIPNTSSRIKAIAAYVTSDLFLGWSIILVIIIPITFITCVHYILWGKPVKGWLSWFPTPRSWWSGFYGWSVILISLIFAFGLTIPFADRLTLNELAETSAGIWFVAAAYLYQLEQIIRRRQKIVNKNPGNSDRCCRG